MKKAVLLIFLLCAFVATSEATYRFTDDFRFGDDINDIYDRLVKADKKILDRDRDMLQYEDVYFGKPCTVILYFTSKTKKLAKISVQWPLPGIVKKAKQLVTDKYGPCLESDTLAFRYTWRESMYDEDNKMTLECKPDAPTRLEYYGGEFWRRVRTEY